MFDDGSIETDADVAMEAVREADWKELHRRLRSIAKRRVALEAEEAGYLVEAEESRLYRRLGYTSMLEYMERELHYGPHAANERLRVAYALSDLPLIGELFRDGELCFSAVRELTRVATPATEEAFLRMAQGKTAHQVQQHHLAGFAQARGRARCHAGPTPDHQAGGHRSVGRDLRDVAANPDGARRGTRRAVVRRRGSPDPVPASYRDVGDNAGRRCAAAGGPDCGHHV